jgi:uroporphyrin-III C-methyltransferase
LVGAGPGDPELLTLKALQAIQRADVILYDRLIDHGILDLARRGARRIDVGKRCANHVMSQAAINDLLIAHARAGEHVVRLKGGDPFVFGRGGEELLALRAAGLDVEVIPGVTAACAAAARLGIPLTHRDLSHGVHFLTGHGKEGGLAAQDWEALASSPGTLAVYMGANTLPQVAARLIAAGMAASMPAVAIENATLPGERAIAGTLGSLPERLRDAGLVGPTLILIGAVVALADPANAAT